jgi:hypothetical protein
MENRAETYAIKYRPDVYPAANSLNIDAGFAGLLSLRLQDSIQFGADCSSFEHVKGVACTPLA